MIGHQTQAKEKPDHRRSPAGATVEVTGHGEQEVEQLRTFTRWITPKLQAAALQGYQERDTVQMLADFMLQDPSHPKPPRVGVFRYMPYHPPPAPAQKP